MRGARKRLCLLLAALMLVSFAPPPVLAADPVHFTAVNDTLLPLDDETMPFWSGGTLYVPHTAFSSESSGLGIYFSYNRTTMKFSLIKAPNSLIFDLAAGTVEDRTGRAYSGRAVLRGSTVFLPVDLICRFFELDYSYTRISYGYLVRIKSAAVVLSDSDFIDAANASMTQRYTRYERTRAGESENTVPPSGSGAVNNAQRTAYLMIESTDAGYTETVLSYLNASRATFLFRPETLAGADNLLRHLTAEGHGVALRVDAAGGAADALRQIEEANRTLWMAANSKTRLVYLDGGSDETLRAVAEAGYCPLLPDLNAASDGGRPARESTAILSSADTHGGSCRVFLGTDENTAAGLSALLTSLRAGNCAMDRLNEAVIS